MADADQQIADCEAVLARLAARSPDRPARLRELAGYLRARHADSREPAALERAVQLGEQALTLTPAGSQAAGGAARELASALRERYLHQPDPAGRDGARDLDRATQLCEEVLRRSAPHFPDRPASLYELGMCLFERQFRDRSIEDLTRAVELLGQAAALAPPGGTDRITYAHGQGQALWDYYEAAGAPETLTVLTGLYARLLADPQTPAGDRPLYHFCLCRAACQLAAASPDPASQGQAVQACEQALAEIPADPGRREDREHRLECLACLASARLDRGVYRGDAGDLTAAADAFGELAALCPIGTPSRYSYLDGLARALGERFRVAGAAGDLDRAIESGEQAVAECPATAPDRAAVVRGTALLYRERSAAAGPPGWPTGLDRAVSLLGEAVSGTLPGTPERPMYLTELAGMLSGRGDAGTGHLQRAADLYEEALAEIPPDSPNRLPVMRDLSLTLFKRSALRAGAADLERAAQVLEQALSETPTDAPGSRDIAGLLGDVLMRRFSLTAGPRDLDRAIEIREQQARQHPPPAPAPPPAPGPFPVLLVPGLPGSRDPRYALASALMLRYWHAHDTGSSGSAADPDRAAALLRELLAEADARDPGRVDTAIVSMLGLTLRSRFSQTGQAADLTEAVGFLEQAAALTPRSSPDWPGTLANLSATLVERWESARDPGDLARAQQLLEDAAAQLPQGSPGRASLLGNLGRFLLDRHAENRETATLKRAVTLLEEAWRLVQPGLVALPAAYKTGQQERWSTLYARLAAGLAELAQASPADAGDCLRTALVVAESAKSRLLADLVGRGELAVPPLPAAGGLAASERQLAAELTMLDTGPEPPDPRQRGALVTELQQVWSRMADTGPEAADYVSLRRGDSPSWAGLARLAADAGPRTALISVFVTAECTLLFVLRAGQDAPAVIRSDLTATHWDDARSRLYREVARMADTTGLEETWDTRLRDALQPAAPHLAGADRLVVSPMAAGHLLPWPLLAERAGWHGPDGPALPVTVLPAPGVLERLRHRRRDEQGPVLVVGNPQGDLGYAGQEAGAVAQALGATPVTGSDATIERILRDIDRARIVHLAAHASFAAGAPLESGIQLADGPLTAAQVMTRRLRATVLTLSGCETGLADIRGGDELAGLAQAFLQAGAHSLVVSLWAVDDEATGTLMAAFYRQLLASPGDGAKALREAMTQVRAAEQWRHPYFWGAFTYIGAW